MAPGGTVAIAAGQSASRRASYGAKSRRASMFNNDGGLPVRTTIGRGFCHYWPKAGAPGGPLGNLAYSPRVSLETRDGYPLLRRDDYRLIPVIVRDPKTDLDENFGFRITGPGGVEEFFSGSNLEDALSRFDALTVGLQR